MSGKTRGTSGETMFDGLRNGVKQCVACDGDVIRCDRDVI